MHGVQMAPARTQRQVGRVVSRRHGMRMAPAAIGQPFIDLDSTAPGLALQRGAASHKDPSAGCLRTGQR
ncbi:conserved hypothetical protein, partial [Ricinus communis]